MVLALGHLNIQRSDEKDPKPAEAKSHKNYPKIKRNLREIQVKTDFRERVLKGCHAENRPAGLAGQRALRIGSAVMVTGIFETGGERLEEGTTEIPARVFP